MDELTQLIRENIKLKYNSVRKFAEALGVPQSTVVSALKKGVAGTSFDTVIKMCSLLDIKFINGVYPVVFNDDMKDVIEKLNSLDALGSHSVHTVLMMEYNRCTQTSDVINFSLSDLFTIASFGAKAEN